MSDITEQDVLAFFGGDQPLSNEALNDLCYLFLSPDKQHHEEARAKLIEHIKEATNG